MIRIANNIQDSTVTKQQDTAKVIKAYKIVPATKIKSVDGAIIPKEAVAMIKLQPSIPVAKEEESMLSTYLLAGALLIGILILFKVLTNKRRKSSV